MLLNDVVAFALSLVLRDGDLLVELVLLTFDHLTDGAAHLLHKKDVKLRVEPILVVLVQAFERALLTEVLLHDSNYGFLHAFFQDVVLARLVDFV